MYKRVLFLLIFSLPLITWADERLDYDTFRKIILEPHCLRCHSGPTSPKGLDFSAYDSLMGNTPFRVIETYNPKNSRLYKAVKSGSMPKGAAKLTDQELKYIFDWIKAGAPEFSR